MSDRTCSRCGKGGVPARCRVHDECLSAGAVGTLVAARKPQVEATLWFDDEADRFKWSERVWMVADCGESVYTFESRGFAHECGQDDCHLDRVSDEQPDVADDIDWEVVDLHTVLPEPPSTFEAGFPEVFFRARGKSDDDTDADEKWIVSRDDTHRWLEMERLDVAWQVYGEAAAKAAVAAAADCPVELRATRALEILRAGAR